MQVVSVGILSSGRQSGRLEKGRSHELLDIEVTNC